jgi:hypothetical protein
MYSPVDPLNHFFYSASDLSWRSLVDPIFYEIQRGSIICSRLREHQLSGLHERGPFCFLVLVLQPASLSFMPPNSKGKPSLDPPVSRVEVSFKKPDYFKLECLGYDSSQQQGEGQNDQRSERLARQTLNRVCDVQAAIATQLQE